MAVIIINRILFVVLITLFVIGMYLLWFHTERDKTHKTLILIIFSWMVSFLGLSVYAFKNYAHFDYYIFPVGTLVAGNINLIIFIVYTLIVLEPSMLKKKTVRLILVFPLFLIVAYLISSYLIGEGAQLIISYQSLISQPITLPFVLRMILALVCIIYSFGILIFILLLQKGYKRNIICLCTDIRNNLKWIQRIVPFYFLFAILYSGILLISYYEVRVLFLLSCILVWALLIERAVFYQPYRHLEKVETYFSFSKGWHIEVKELTITDELSESEVEKLYRKVEDWLLLTKRFCDKNFASSEILDQFKGLNMKTLSFIIEQKHNCSFQGYIQLLRIQESINLIENDRRLSLKDISDKVGFSNQSAYTRSFIHVKGYTPREYTKEKA